jgi:AraC-like DNA-binding protein
MANIAVGADVPSTMGTWIQAIVHALDGQGINGTELALRAGVSPRVFRNVEERVPQPVVTRLWALAVEATGDPCFGLLVPRFVTPAAFHALGYAILASPNVHAVFQRWTRFQRLVTDAIDQRLELAGDRYRLTIERNSAFTPPHEAVDAFMATGVRALRGLSGAARINPLAIYMQRPEPTPSEPFHKVFRCPIRFGAPKDVVEYSRKDVEAPLPYANAELARQSDAIVADYLARSGRDGTLADRVRALLVEHLPDGGPSEETIARRLCVSPRSLQLQLAQEGTTYKTLLNRARQSLASSYLQQGRYSIKEIAFLLGFSDAATFTRAFRRWTGQTPRRFAEASGQ